MGTGRFVSALVGLCRSVSGTAFVASLVRQLSIDLDGRLWRRCAPPAMALQLVVPAGECRGFIHRYHDSIFAGHLGVSPDCLQVIRSSVLSGTSRGYSFISGQLFGVFGPEVSMSSPCTDVGHRWDLVAMDILDMSVTTDKGNRYVLVIVDCFSRWTVLCPIRRQWLWLTHFSS